MSRAKQTNSKDALTEAGENVGRGALAARIAAIKQGIDELKQEHGRTPGDPSRHQRRAMLHRDQIVEAALAIADAEGLDAVSMRRVAAALGSGTMSLYGHVPDKQTLIELMVDRVFGELPTGEHTGEWRTDASAFAYRMRDALVKHPWLPVLGNAARPLFTPALYRNLMDHMEYSFSIYDGLGLDIRVAAAFDMLIDTYVMGFVAREHGDHAEEAAADGPEKAFFEGLMPQLYRVLTDGEHRRVAAFMQAMQPGILDMLAEGASIFDVHAMAEASGGNSHVDYNEEIFALGLECILDGIAARIAAETRSAAT